MATLFDLQGAIQLEPVWWRDPPLVKIELDADVLYEGSLEKTIDLRFSRPVSAGDHRLTVRFFNKTDQDTDVVDNRDKAVIVKEIQFFDIRSPRFVWNGIYEPDYPEHLENNPKILKYHNYLSWNGVWYLDFTAPVFTWIHQVEDLGWIHS